MKPSSKYPSSNNAKKLLPFLVAILIIAAILCVFAAVAGLFLLRNRRTTPVIATISLEPRNANGQLSGTYQSSHDQVVHFSVSTDGSATYRLHDLPESPVLAIEMPSDDTASMTWQGISMDGYGEMDEIHLAALSELMNSDLAQGIMMIPLDLACQSEGQIDPNQLAGLLFPLQMHYKYQVTNRSAISQELIKVSQCNYGSNLGSQLQATSLLYITPANPIPVVFGYFPFDVEGAVEAPISGINGDNPACVSSQYSLETNKMVSKSGLLSQVWSEKEPIINQWGACGAMCRGACGPDCTTNNCSMEVATRCQKDEDGANTGVAEQIHIYDCGLHPACIKHDACYDSCNSYWGCDTWGAGYCRHGGSALTANPAQFLLEKAMGYSFCDLDTLAEEPFLDVVGWVDGYGPQPIRQQFVYTDETHLTWYDLEECPVLSDSEEVEESQEGSDLKIPTGLFIGVITDTEMAMGGLFEWQEEGTITNNEVVIRIDEFGNVSGSFLYEKVGNILHADYSHVSPCISSHDILFTGEASGKLDDFTGRILFEITQTTVSKLTEGCSIGPKETVREADHKQRFEIEIIDTLMVGKSISLGDEFGHPIKAEFLLELK